jgi:hypothetical protein
MVLLPEVVTVGEPVTVPVYLAVGTEKTTTPEPPVLPANVKPPPLAPLPVFAVPAPPVPVPIELPVPPAE